MHKVLYQPKRLQKLLSVKREHLKLIGKDPDVKEVSLHSVPVYESDGRTVAEECTLCSPLLCASSRDDSVRIGASGSLITDPYEEGNPAAPDFDY